MGEGTAMRTLEWRGNELYVTKDGKTRRVGRVVESGLCPGEWYVFVRQTRKHIFNDEANARRTLENYAN